MTLHEFKQLSINDQCESTWQNGVLLGFRQEGETHMTLYRIENFYVELYYRQNDDDISEVKSFISGEPLKPYLDKIDLSDIL